MSKQNVAVHIKVDTGRRDFPCEFYEGDFCKTKCAVAWLEKFNGRTGY